MARINYSIAIKPIMTNGDSSSEGDYLLFNNKKITSIQIDVRENACITYLNHNNEITPLISILSIDLNNDISNMSLTPSTITLTITDGLNINSPYLDLFRKGDLIQVSYYYEETPDTNYAISGQISNITTSMGIEGMIVSLTIDSMTQVLKNSMAVQFKTDWDNDNFKINTITAQYYKLGDLIQKLISETVLTKLSPTVKYMIGLSPNVTKGYNTNPYLPNIDNGIGYFPEQLAKGTIPDPNSPAIINNSDKGSALNKDTYLYVYVNPTSSKLDVIAQTIYPYQRVLYSDVNGSLIISPLNDSLHPDNWACDISKDVSKEDKINLESYVKSESLMPVNRVFIAYNPFFVILNQTLTPSGLTREDATANTAQSISLPGSYFTRDYETANSVIGTRTETSINGINSDIIRNSGFLNINNGIEQEGGIVGLFSNIAVNSNKASITNFNEGIKNTYTAYSNIYAANSMAEKLFAAEQYSIKMPLVSTYSKELKRLRNIPLNSLVEVNGKQLFCYGYNLNYSLAGSNLTLKLCRPFTLKALWAKEVKQI